MIKTLAFHSISLYSTRTKPNPKTSVPKIVFYLFVFVLPMSKSKDSKCLLVVRYITACILKWCRLGVSVTLLEENIDHLTHGTTGLITWQVRYSKEGSDFFVCLHPVLKYVEFRSVECFLQNVSGMVWLKFPPFKQERWLLFPP
jgi:hypothetical protein